VLGEVVHEHGDDEEDQGSRQDGRENEDVAEPVHLRGPEHSDERDRPGWGVQRMSELQYRDRRRDRQRAGDADMRSKHLVRRHADEGRHQLSDDKVAGLCEIGVGSAVQQRGGRAERSDEKQPRGERQIDVQARDRDQEDPDRGGTPAQEEHRDGLPDRGPRSGSTHTPEVDGEGRRSSSLVHSG
jgi:hypothetical protein